MYYPELLRVRNGLLIALIALASVVASFALLIPPCRSCHVAVSAEAGTIAVIGWSAALLAAIFGSIYAASLACVSDGHLELAWTQPVNRTAQAIGILLIDIAGILAIFALAYGAGYLVGSLFEARWVQLSFDGASLLKTARYLAFPFAMFGLMQSISAGIKGGWYGAVIGPAWPVTMLLFGLTQLPLVAPWHALARILNIPNPMMYFPYWEFDEGIRSFHTYDFGYGLPLDTLALSAIALVGMVVATLRWRRLEA
jgi:hypothetical protein